VDSKSGLVQHPFLTNSNNAQIEVKSICPRVKEILAIDQNYAHITTHKGNVSPLLAAVLVQDEDSVDILLDNNADPDTPDVEGRTPLWWAARFGNTAIVGSLMSFGAAIDPPIGPGVLHLAVLSQKRSTVLAILRHPNLDVNQGDKKQRTALHYAAALRNTRILKMMFDVEEINVFARDSQGMTPLFYAALYGRVKNVRLLINEGYFVYESINRNEIQMNPPSEGQLSSLIISDPVDNQGMTPLLWACWSGQLEVVAILCYLENGYSAADTKARDLKGRSSLHFTVLGLHKALAQKSIKRAIRIVDIIQILVKSGADARALDHYDRTPLHLLVQNLPFMDSEQTELVLKAVDLLVQAGTPLRKQNRFGLTVMQLAAQTGHVALLKHLFSRLGNPVDLKSAMMIDGQGRSLLHHVVFGLKNQKEISPDSNVDFPQCAVFLLQNGISDSIIDKKGKTALQLAVQYGLPSLSRVLGERTENFKGAELLQLFLKGRRHTTESLQILLEKLPSGNLGSRDYLPVLVAAAKYLFDEKCWQLIQRNVQLNDEFLQLLAQNASLLHAAAKSGNKIVFDWLLESNLDKTKLLQLFEKTDAKSNTVLHLVFKHGAKSTEKYRPLAELLLSNCSKPVYGVKNNRGKTALHFAAQWSTSYVDKLCANGIDVNMRDNNGVTPLHEAIAVGNVGTITSLIINGADVTLVDFKLRTIFHWLAYWSHKSNYDGTTVLETILALDLNGLGIMESVDINGQTPFHYLAKYGTHDLTLFNKLMGQSRDMLDGTGDSALHLASQYGHTSIVQELLNTQMNVNTLNHNGMTALMVAAQYGQRPVMQLLLEHFADIHVQDNQGRTALHWAVHGKNLACITLVWSDDLGTVEDNNDMMPIDIAWQQNNAMSFMKLENLINKTERTDSEDYEEEDEEDTVNVIFDEEDELMATDDDSDSEEDEGDSDEDDGDKTFDELFNTDFLAGLESSLQTPSEQPKEQSKEQDQEVKETAPHPPVIAAIKLDQTSPLMMEVPNSNSTGLTPTVPSPRLLRISSDSSVIGTPDQSPLSSPSTSGEHSLSPRTALKRTDSGSRFARFAMPTYMSTFMKKFTPEGAEITDGATSPSQSGEHSPQGLSAPSLENSTDSIQYASVALVKQMIEKELAEKIKEVKSEFEEKIKNALAEQSNKMADIKKQQQELLTRQKQDFDELSKNSNVSKDYLNKLTNHIALNDQIIESLSPTSSADQNNNSNTTNTSD
jgi:ankyrin repeat protein